MRGAALVLVVGAALVAGLVVGSALAPLPYSANDECQADAPVARGAEGAVYSASLDLWPLRIRCDYEAGPGASRSRLIGPTVAETLAWSALVALLVGAALRRRRSAPLLGAVLAACFLAPATVAVLYSEFILACWVAMWIGVPIVFVLDRALRPPGERAWRQSALVAFALSAVVFVACFVPYLAGFGRAGIAAGIAAGALGAGLLPRVWSPAAQPS